MQKKRRTVPNRYLTDTFTKWQKGSLAKMSHSRHSCRSRVFANTHETVCFLPLVCGSFLAAIRANMQSHPLYLNSSPSLTIRRIALFSSVYRHLCVGSHRLPPSADRDMCVPTEPGISPICPARMPTSHRTSRRTRPRWRARILRRNATGHRGLFGANRTPAAPSVQRAAPWQWVQVDTDAHRGAVVSGKVGRGQGLSGELNRAETARSGFWRL